MMSEMGKKRNIKIFSADIAAIFVFSVAGLAIMQTGNPVNAAPSSNIGVVDTSKIITPDNQDAVAAQKQLQQAGSSSRKCRGNWPRNARKFSKASKIKSTTPSAMSPRPKA